MQIMPALLEKVPESLFFQIRRLSPFFRSFQIDITDGVFVPNKTVQIEELIILATHYKSLIPNRLIFDFHLMVKNYVKEIKILEKLKNYLNIKNVFIHFSLLPNFELLTARYKAFSLGLVLNPNDSIEQLTTNYNLQTLSCIQIMSVNPGFQGSQFLPETLTKIEQLRNHGYRSKIYLDGGINQTSVPIIKSKKFRPDYLCIGSYLIKSAKIDKTISDLQYSLQK